MYVHQCVAPQQLAVMHPSMRLTLSKWILSIIFVMMPSHGDESGEPLSHSM